MGGYKFARKRVADILFASWGTEGLMYHSGLTNRKAGTKIIGINCQTDGTGNPQQKDVGIIGYYGTNVTYKQYLFIQTGIVGSGAAGQEERREWIRTNFKDAIIIYEKE